MRLFDRIFGRKKKTQIPIGQPKPGYERPQTTAEKLGVSEKQYRKMSDSAAKEMEWQGLSYQEAMNIEVQKVKEAREIAMRAEKTRRNAEQKRQTAEQKRQNAERKRKKAELERRKEWEAQAARIKASGKKIPVRRPKGRPRVA